jgi:hypothetical protein
MDPTQPSNITMTSGTIGNSFNITAQFDVNSINCSSLNMIQVVLQDAYTADGGLTPGTPLFSADGCSVLGTAFVDGGVNSPYAASNGGSTMALGLPNNLTPSTDGFSANSTIGYSTWDASSQTGTVNLDDQTNAPNSIQNVNFTTYIIATNYNGSGQDVILGNITWGWSNGVSVTGNSPQFTSGSGISQTSQAIIANDYPTYNFYH